jgi:tetratricopeptide (TPR) repeat protein
MLNYTQQQILDAILDQTLLEDSDYQSLKAHEAIQVLESIIDDEKFNKNKSLLNSLNVLDIVLQIRRILKHECPQNVSQTHYDTKVGYVCYKDFYGKRIVEKKGLLGLTAKNDSTAEPVTKRDVVKYITDVIEREISYQQRLMKREKEILDSCAKSNSPVFPKREGQQSQTVSPHPDDEEDLEQQHIELPPQNDIPHHHYSSSQQQLQNSDSASSGVSYSSLNNQEEFADYSNLSANDHQQLTYCITTSHVNAPQDYETQMRRTISSAQLPPSPSSATRQLPHHPFERLPRQQQVTQQQHQQTNTGTSLMQDLWLSLEGLNYFGYQSGELCRYYEEQIDGVMSRASPINVDLALSELEDINRQHTSNHVLLDEIFRKFLVCYLQFYCMEDYDTQPFAALLEQLKHLIDDSSNTPYTNCLGNLTILCTYLRGICFENQKLYNSAIPHFKRVLRMDPMFARAYLHRGKCYYLLNNYEKAREDFSNAILVDSTLSEAYSYRGLCFFVNEKYERAIEDYDKAIELDDQDYRPYAYRGECLCTQKKFRNALVDYDKAIALNNNDAYIFYGRGLCYKNLEHYEPAIEDFTKAIQLEPNRKDAYFARGTCYLASGKYNQAINDFTTVIQANNSDALAFFYRGMCFYRNEMIDVAMTDFKITTQLDPENARAYNYLGCCFSLKKQYNDAILCFEKAIELDSRLSLAYFNAARSYYFLKDYRKAIKRYNTSIVLDPSHANSYMGRAQVYAKLGKYHKALRDVKIALARDPQNRVYLKYFDIYSTKFEQSRGWLKKAVKSMKSKLQTHIEGN